MFRLQIEAIESILPNKRVLIMDDHKGGRRSVIYIGESDLLTIVGARPPGNDEEK
jgi:hypothetical protein